MQHHNTSSNIRTTLFTLASAAVLMAGLTGTSIALAQGNAPIQVTVQNSGYEQWGRPAGMDNPQAGCNDFDNSRPVSKFNVSVQVKNNAKKDMASWGMSVIKNDGKEAFVCYYIQDSGFPTIAPGQFANVTFAAFMEKGETAARVIVIDDVVGQSAPINFNAAGKPTGSSKPAPAPRPTATPRVTTTNAINVSLLNTGYEKWGRPVGMDNPQAGCSSFDDSRPVTKYNISLQVKNNSKQDMTDWYAAVFKANGKEAFVCYYIQDGGLPNVPAGGMVNVTFAAFMEPGEKAVKLVVFDKNVGRTKDIKLP